MVCAFAEVPVVDNIAVAFAGGEVLVSVVGDVFAKSLSVVDKSVGCPEVEEAVGGWGSCESDDSVDFGPDFFECFEAFGLWVFEARQFVNDDHVVGPVVFVVVDEPRDVFSADGVDVCLLVGGCFPLWGGARDGADGESCEVVPFFDFVWPCVACDAGWCDDERSPGLEAVSDEFVDGGEGGDCFAHAHS